MAGLIREIFYREDICKRCKTREEKRAEVESGRAKTQSCDCVSSRYHCWLDENVKKEDK